MRTLIVVISLVFLFSGIAYGESPSHVLKNQILTWTDNAGAALAVLQGSGTGSGLSYFPSITGMNIADYESFGYDIVLDDGSDSAIDVDITVEVSSSGGPLALAGTSTAFSDYTQNCIFPNDEVATATLNIDDEDYHHGSIHPAPQKWIRFVFTNNNADIDVVPVFVFTTQ